MHLQRVIRAPCKPHQPDPPACASCGGRRTRRVRGCGCSAAGAPRSPAVEQTDTRSCRCRLHSYSCEGCRFIAPAGQALGGSRSGWQGWPEMLPRIAVRTSQQLQGAKRSQRPLSPTVLAPPAACGRRGAQLAAYVSPHWRAMRLALYETLRNSCIACTMKRAAHLKLRLCGATGTSKEQGTLGATMGPPAARNLKVAEVSGSTAGAFKGAGHAGGHHGPACSKELAGC